MSLYNILLCNAAQACLFVEATNVLSSTQYVAIVIRNFDTDDTQIEHVLMARLLLIVYCICFT